QVANTHEHLGLRITASDFNEASQRGGEPEADRLDDRIDAERHAPAHQRFHDAVEPIQRRRHIGYDDHFATPGARCSQIAAVDAQYKLGPRSHCLLDFYRIEAINGNAQTFLPECLDCGSSISPGPSGIAPQIDDIGPGFSQGPRLREYRIATQPRYM